jgi:hypothetical protein
VAGEVLLVTQFLAAGLMLLLAGWLLYLNFHSRVVRAFSLFLLLRAVAILSNQFGRIMGEPYGTTYWAGVRGYYELGVIPALAYFLMVYARPSGRWRRVGTWLLLAFTVVVELAYAADHCASYCKVGVEEGAPFEMGPLSLLTSGIPMAFAWAGLFLLSEAHHAVVKAHRAGALLAGAVFFFNGLVETSLTLSYAVQKGTERFLENFEPNAWQWVPLALPLMTGVVLVATYVPLARMHAEGSRRKEALVIVGVSVLAIVSGVVMTFIELGETLTLLLLGAWRLSLPVVVSIAILRHRLFGLDGRIKVGIRRGLVAGTLLAAFFSVSKITENLVAAQFPDGTVGVYAGGIVAGLLLFAISPLQKLAERVAQATVPTANAMDGIPVPERLEFYRDQAQIAWSDGVLGRRERLLLDRLRERLGIPPVEAARIETEAASRLA